MRNRQEEIRSKGFAMTPRADRIDDYAKMRVGLKTLDDANIDLNFYKKLDSSRGDKSYVLKALKDHNYKALREISNLFYETSGIYQRLCKYLAYLYRFDWYVIPFVGLHEAEKVNGNEKVLKEFSNLLNYLDNSYLKKQFGEIALKVVREGSYYGIIIPGNKYISIQELPQGYCRSRFNSNGFPAVEFNMKYFDDAFPDINYRLKIINTFPKDFIKGYLLYKQGKLKPEFQGDQNGWYLLDPTYAFKINCAGSDFPILANVIPAIIDLGEAQELDRKKTMQKLLKIVIQKLPMDKNGDLVFDIDEAADIHANAVAMLKRAIGVDVLTTFADIDVADMSDKNTTTSVDDLEKVERALYNESGSAQSLFNSDSNLALEKSTLNDEASMRSIPQQFEFLLNRLINHMLPNKKYCYKFKILETTIYNYKDLSKLYKEQTSIGYSKMLPQIALGHSQSEILGAANFENNILNLTTIMIPPLSSNTMSGASIPTTGNKDKTATAATGATKKDAATQTEENKSGRPEKPDNEKSDKTIANKESM